MERETSPDAPSPDPASPKELLGEKLGHYRLLESLGRGGMGEVYAAWDETLERRVALKSVLGLVSREPRVRERFLREARILSRLEHPNICRIHDFLETGVGDFLVLELIEGDTLRSVLDAETPRHERIRLALGILEALAAAHREGVVHRDLKPGNVMVTEDGRVKVLDFGLAAAVPEEQSTMALSRLVATRADVGADEEEEAGRGGPMKGVSPRFTAAGAVLGTPAYMSPEQARGLPATPASDLYAFGLVLRELLAGRELAPAGVDQVALLVRALEADAPEVSGLPRPLDRLLGELADPEPSRRPSAEATRARLEAFLGRARRRLFASTAIIALLAVGAGVVRYVVDVSEARARAEAALNAAEASGQETEEVVELLLGLFETSDPARSLGETVTARELLERGADRILENPDLEPRIRARLLEAVGRVLVQLGLYDDSEEILRTALELRRASGDPVTTAAAEHLLGHHYWEAGDTEKASVHLERALKLRTAELAANAPEMAETLAELGSVRQIQARWDEAERLIRRALAIRESHFGPESLQAAASLQQLAILQGEKGELERAAELHERVLRMREERLPEGHPAIARSLNGLGIALARLGREEEAVGLLRRSLEIRERNLGPEHSEVAQTLNNLGQAVGALGDEKEERALLERSLETWEKVVGPEHPRIGFPLYNLAQVHLRRDEPDLAVPLLRRARDLFAVDRGESHPLVAHCELALGRARQSQGDLDAARAHFERALEIRSRLLDPGSEEVAEVQELLADL